MGLIAAKPCQKLKQYNIMKLNLGWHVLYVRYRQEEKVYKSLINEGLKAFLPKTTVIKKWSDRKKKQKIPLFPSYVFVYINSNLDFYKASKTNGACSFVKFGNKLAIVKDSEIDKILFLTNNNFIKNVKSDMGLPKLGEIMEITYGPLQGLKCRIERINNDYKIQVSIDSLQQSIYAIVPHSFLSPTYTC